MQVCLYFDVIVAGQFSDLGDGCCQYGQGKDARRGRAEHKDQGTCQVSHMIH